MSRPILNPGQRFLITGGGRGIGFAVAQVALEEGGRVVIVDRDQPSLEAAVESLKGAGFKPEDIASFVGDVTQKDTAKNAVAFCVEQFGGVDTLVTAAGITKDRTTVKMEEAQFDAVINVNLKGTFLFAQAAIQHWAAVGYANVPKGLRSIVPISSIVGIEGNFGQANYAASKAGVIGLSKSLARELGRNGARVVAIAPGFTQTAMTAEMPEAVKEYVKGNTPMGRMADAVEIADAVIFVASPRSSFTTGTVFPIDGGFTCH